MDDVFSHTDEWAPLPLDIPPHWEQIEFEDAFENISLAHLKIPQKDYLSSGTIPIIDQGVNLIGGFTNDASKSIQSTRALIVFGDHTKCFKLIGFRFAPGADGIKVLKPITIDERFAYYACRALRLPDRGYSRHYAFLKKSKIPLAPQNEQLRIVAKIEELFSELDKGVESLKTARAQLYIYRQVMIKHAFEGKLTADWREENKDKLDTPEQLLACIKQERQAYYEMKLEDWKTAIARSGATTKRGRRPRKPNPPLWTNASSRDSSVEDDKLPVSWTSGALGSLFEVVSGATPKGLRHVEGGDLPFYKVSDMNSPGNETRMDAAAMYLSEEQQTELGLTVHPAGTIIFPKRGGAILTNKKRLLSRPACFDLNTMGVINPIVRISTDYLWYWFQSLDLSGIYDGSNVPQINNKDIEPLRVPICTAQEQVEIVRVLERVLSVNDQMKSEIDKELWKASALRQAILTRAFAGQLVAQDPSDEPASVLLDRIRTQKNQQAEREMVTRSTKKKRKTTREYRPHRLQSLELL